MTYKSKLVQALGQELRLRKAYLEDEPVNSIYFGGGTPSLLEEHELQGLLAEINASFMVAENAEITLEANPDDLTLEKLRSLKASGVNRLSIGIQTFDEERLRFVNRAHTRQQALSCLENARVMGFENITADLIYAIPPDDMRYWENDLRQILSFDLPHLSIYGLTIEEKTAFGNWLRKGRLKAVQEELSAHQYQLAMEVLTENGYTHYEVSNFARSGMYSRHNSAYWEDQKYLGVGPGAHSYNGRERAYNISNNKKYIDCIYQDELPITIDSLSETDKVNEYLLTHLRTLKGVDLNMVKKTYQRDLEKDYAQELNHFLERKLIIVTENKLQLTSKGFLVADEISVRLFYDE